MICEISIIRFSIAGVDAYKLKSQRPKIQSLTFMIKSKIIVVDTMCISSRLKDAEEPTYAQFHSSWP